MDDDNFLRKPNKSIDVSTYSGCSGSYIFSLRNLRRTSLGNKNVNLYKIGTVGRQNAL